MSAEGPGFDHLLLHFFCVFSRRLADQRKVLSFCGFKVTTYVDLEGGQGSIGSITCFSIHLPFCISYRNVILCVPIFCAYIRSIVDIATMWFLDFDSLYVGRLRVYSAISLIHDVFLS
jgi:hypothetical protein